MIWKEKKTLNPRGQLDVTHNSPEQHKQMQSKQKNQQLIDPVGWIM